MCYYIKKKKYFISTGFSLSMPPSSCHPSFLLSSFLSKLKNELPGIVRQGIEEMVRLEETEKEGKKERIYTYEKAMQR